VSARRSKLFAYAALSWLPHATGYVAAPLLVSLLGERHGWKSGRPGAPNLVGAALLGAGAAFIGWAIVSHYRASPDEVQFRATPNYLVTNGAYAVSRNPLYVGGAAMWVGWAVLLGSIPIIVAGAALFGLLAAVGVPYEERMLSDRFGEVYAAYRSRTPRWIKFNSSSEATDGSRTLD
jgi:protein-S-isoprenylcysteine O-methyltransferase Ste14